MSNYRRTLANRQLEDLAKLADQAGSLKASIRTMQDKLDDLNGDIEEGLRALKITEIDGDLFRAVLVHREVEKTDWKAVAAKLNPSHQLVSGNSKMVVTDFVQINARKVAAA